MGFGGKILTGDMDASCGLNAPAMPGVCVCVCVCVCVYEKYITQGASLLLHPFTVTVMPTFALSGVVLHTQPPGDVKILQVIWGQV